MMKSKGWRYYTYCVKWSQEDKEFVGLCSEFPSLSYLHPDLYIALEGIIDLVVQIDNDMHNDETIDTSA